MTENHRPLEREIAVFEEQRAQLLERAEGKYVLIKGDQVVDTFDSSETAYERGIEEFGNVEFLIKQILSEETEDSIPALHLGLLYAHP